MQKKRTVLAVDDESYFTFSLSRALRKEPYTVLTTNSGAEALSLLRDHEVHLAVVDYMMPGMDGLTFIKKIRQDYPHIITIMLTARSDIEIAIDAINTAGVYKFLLKPIDIEAFKVELRRALEFLDTKTGQDTGLEKLKTRDAILQELEREYPGITEY